MSDGTICKERKKQLEEIMGLVGYVKMEGLVVQQGGFWLLRSRISK